MAINYYQQLSRQQINGPSNIAYKPMETETYVKDTINTINKQITQENANDNVKLQMAEYYQKKGEEEELKQSKLNSLVIENAFKKDVEQLNTKYTDLTDPKQRELYRQDLKQLYTQKNELLHQKVTPEMAYKMTITTNKAIKKQFMQKISENILNTLTQTYIQNAKTDPVEAWKKTDTTYKTLISTAKTPEEKVAMMDAWMQLKKTTSADEAFDKEQQHWHNNRVIDTKVTDALSYFKKQGIKIDSVYTDPTQFKHDQQVIHDYAMKHGWDTATEARALDYIKLQQNVSNNNNNKYSGTNTDILTQDNITTYETNPSITIKSVPIKVNGKVYKHDAIEPKYAADLLAGSLPPIKLESFGLKNYIQKGIKPEQYATDILKLNPTDLKKLNYALEHPEDKKAQEVINNIVDYNTYFKYSAYKEYYDLATGNNKVFQIPATELTNTNDDNILLWDDLKIPKDKIRKIDVNGVPTYFITSKDIQKFANGKPIKYQEKTILNGKIEIHSNIALPKYGIIKPEYVENVTEIGLFHTFIGTGTRGKNNTKITNAYMMSHPNKYMNTKNNLFKKYFNAYKAKNPNTTKEEYFNTIYKPAYINAMKYANPYYNAKRFSKDMPGLTVIPPKSDIGKMHLSDYAFKLQPKEILKDPKQSIKFLRILDLTASKSGRPIKGIKTLYKLAKDKPEEFREKFYTLLNNNVDGCKYVGNGISECMMRYDGIFNLIKALRDNK